MASPSAARRRPIIGVSTKMYFSPARTAAFVDAVLSLLSSPSSPPGLSPLSRVDAFILPDFLCVADAARAVAARSGSSDPDRAASECGQLLLVGAQDCCEHHDPDCYGPFTGDVSAASLREVGCALVAVGHAERRRRRGETDAVVRGKALAVARNGMVPLICVGEEHRGEGGVEDAVAEVVRQVGEVLGGLEDTNADAQVMVAYEPVWAIGAAEPAPAAYVRDVVRGLRASEVLGLDDERRWKGRVRIVYGGAARPGLWEELRGEVDGLFVGRFGHEPEQFVKMIYEVAGMQREG